MNVGQAIMPAARLSAGSERPPGKAARSQDWLPHTKGTHLNSRILITGATRGLGRAIAQQLWQSGASLALVARSASALDQLRAEWQAEGSPRLWTLAADLADPAAPAHIAAELGRHWTTLDGLVNNAGIVGPIGPAWENDPAEWQRAIQVNLLSPAALCRLLLPSMTAGASIVNLSGGGATSPRPNFSAYATAKAGLVRFTENLAHEAAARGVRVNAVAPGAMNTEMLEAVLRTNPEMVGREFESAVKQKAKGGVPPEKAAELVVYLLSGIAEGITGRLISAVWDPWPNLAAYTADLAATDIYTLRRITPEDRGKEWK
jgi:3-oxoacyl-[acyl-carrier protein] reductase